MNILVVEDMVIRQDWFRRNITSDHNVFFADNYDSATSFLQSVQFDLVFLDHDLGNGPNGVDVAKWMKDNTNPLPPTIIHSLNPVGATNISSCIPSTLCPFGRSLLDKMKELKIS